MQHHNGPLQRPKNSRKATHMPTQTFGRWSITMHRHLTIPCVEENLDKEIARLDAYYGDIISRIEPQDNGTLQVHLVWVGDVHADEEDLETAGIEAMQADGHITHGFTLDDTQVTYEGYDPSDYADM